MWEGPHATISLLTYVSGVKINSSKFNVKIKGDKLMLESRCFMSNVLFFLSFFLIFEVTHVKSLMAAGLNGEFYL